jgi:hypothetical protein
MAKDLKDDMVSNSEIIITYISEVESISPKVNIFKVLARQ